MKEIVILGAGYAGLRAARELRGLPGARITLVNRHAFHYESTELHTVAAGTREPEVISFDIRQSMGPTVEFKQDSVTRIDLEQKKVFLQAGPEPLSYDYLVVALGFESEDFGIDGAREHAMPLVDIDSALAVRQHFEARLAGFKTTRDENDLRLIVCGAGFTSIERCGEFAYRMPSLIELHDLPKDKVQLIALESAPKLLPMFDAHLVDYAVGYLAARGVQIHTSTTIKKVVPGGVMSEDRTFNANTIIWTTGVRGSHVIADSGFVAKRNRVNVEPTLALKDHPEVFFIGDDSAVFDPAGGRPWPTTAQLAIAEATHAAANIKAHIAGRPIADFKFVSKGTVCSLGPSSGIAQLSGRGSMKFEGHGVAFLKKLVENGSLLEEAGFAKMLDNFA